jgi:hypothetical protein
MARNDWPTDPAEIRRAIETAIQELVEQGLLVDSGERRWSQQTKRYEIVWVAIGAGNTGH